MGKGLLADSRSQGIYSSVIVENAIGDSATMSQVLGWDTLINAFYLPGTLVNLFSSWLAQTYSLFLLTGWSSRNRQARTQVGDLYPYTQHSTN
jgi:uncharacterized membrane protein